MAHRQPPSALPPLALHKKRRKIPHFSSSPAIGTPLAIHPYRRRPGLAATQEEHEMKKLLAILAIATVAFLSTGGDEANAQGIHIGGRGIHVDIGRPHGGHYGHHSSFYGGHSYRGHHGGHGRHGGSHFYHGGHGGHGSHYRWHDTSHYDFHPGGYVRHYDHYDYIPPHYDFHREGHWDRH
jgi:hypothetical protein